MSISVLARKLLWGRAGNRCAFPSCKAVLIEDELSIGADTVVGEEAHIVAQKADGPRGADAPPGGDRDGYPNLILLCATHHKIVDEQVQIHTVDGLVKMKAAHERAVRAALSPPDAKRIDDEVLYAEIVDGWAHRAMLDNWDGWTSGILYCGQPLVDLRHVTQLRDLARWLLTRVWPRTNPQLEAAFATYRTVLADFLNELEANSQKVGRPGDEVLEIEKFYKAVKRWDPPQYELLRAKFNRAVHLVEQLGVELTRAANLVCDIVRRTLSPRFRRDEGNLVMTSGPTVERWDTVRVSVYSYPPGVDPATAYRGLGSFRAEALAEFPDPS